jgi:hypothetical protein
MAFPIVSVAVKLHPLDGKSSGFEADVAALMGLVPAQPKDVLPFAVNVTPFLGAQDARV